MTAVEGRANALFGANAEALRMDEARMIAEVASFMLKYFLFYCNGNVTDVFSLVCDASYRYVRVRMGRYDIKKSRVVFLLQINSFSI